MLGHALVLGRVSCMLQMYLPRWRSALLSSRLSRSLSQNMCEAKNMETVLERIQVSTTCKLLLSCSLPRILCYLCQVFLLLEIAVIIYNSMFFFFHWAYITRNLVSLAVVVHMRTCIHTPSATEYSLHSSIVDVYSYLWRLLTRTPLLAK